jgi:hypothetical protein
MAKLRQQGPYLTRQHDRQASIIKMVRIVTIRVCIRSCSAERSPGAGATASYLRGTTLSQAREAIRLAAVWSTEIPAFFRGRRSADRRHGCETNAYAAGHCE